MELIFKYFPELPPTVCTLLDRYMELFGEWNHKINLVSRPDFRHFEERHLLHSLSIAKIFAFPQGTRIIDVGTGGGLPGLPLAIVFPDCNFILMDSTGKKIMAVDHMIRELGLKNVSAIHCRSEDYKGSCDYVLARAVSSLTGFIRSTRHLLPDPGKGQAGNGILYLKGDTVTEELGNWKYQHKIFRLSDLFSEPFFTTKVLVHLVL